MGSSSWLRCVPPSPVPRSYFSDSPARRPRAIREPLALPVVVVAVAQTWVSS
jgi:hypothetical protein